MRFEGDAIRMEADLEARLMQRALELGLLNPSDAKRAEDWVLHDETVVPPPKWGAKLDSLRRHGRLDRADLDRLWREVFEESETHVGFRSNGRPPDPDDDVTEADSRPAFPVQNWDRFEFRRMIGQGGMGVVYEAWDLKLNRVTALKFLRGGNEHLMRRFLREARAQGRIEHENVCKVYETGEVEGKPYIAMQFIDGKPVGEARTAMTLEQKVQVVRDTALALHAAHRLGIIHRDIKPDNVLVTQAEDGQWRPTVMDFGLAREVGNRGLTETGMVMGTPGYMSPEQARGDVHQLDRRSDVYSLGVLLYELLTGKRPFQAETAMKVMLKVINDDPVPISRRNAAIPPDLDTVTMKCLEKDPNHRYESAQTLAGDLQRFLDGEPISVKPTTWHTRIVKKARKHKAMIALGSVAAVLVLALGCVAAWTWWQSRRQAELARQMGEQAEKVEALLRFASLTAPHDLRTDRKMARQEMEIIRRRMTEAGNLGEGPGNYALGRGHLAFFDYDKAREHLERARDAGFRAPGLDLALSQALGDSYRREMDELPQIEDKESRDAQMKKLETEYLIPIRSHLTAYLQARSEESSQESAYLEGLSAFYGGDYPRALERAQIALGHSSWFYEARLLEGDVYTAWGKQKAAGGKYDEANDLWAKAEIAFEAAARIGPSNPQAPLGLARKWSMILKGEVYKGKRAEEPIEKLLAACDRVLVLDPDHAEACLMKATGYWRLGEARARHDEDPADALDQAASWAQRATTANPTLVEAYRVQGSIFRTRGRYELDRGRDPRAWMSLAVAALQKAVELNPTRPNAYNTLGLVWKSRAQYEIEHGQDPRSAFDQAEANLRKAVELNADSANALSNFAILLEIRGEHEAATGRDPRPTFDQAFAAFQKALELNPNYVHALSNLGLLRIAQAEHEATTGGDPRATFGQALDTLKKALALNPKYPPAFMNLALLHRALGRRAFEGGRNPTAALDAARTNLDEAAKLRWNNDTIHRVKAEVEIIAARWAMNQNASPEPHFTEAEKSVAKAVELEPGNAESRRIAAQLAVHRAEWLTRRGRDPRAVLISGLESVEKSLAVNPRDAEVNAVKGALLLAQAKASGIRATDAVKSLEEALRLNQWLRREYEPLLNEAKRNVAEARKTPQATA